MQLINETTRIKWSLFHMTSDHHPLSQHLRSARKRAGMSLSILSQHSGVSIGTLSKWESGQIKNPHVKALYRVAELLKIDHLEHLFNWHRIEKSREQPGSHDSSPEDRGTAPTPPPYRYFGAMLCGARRQAGFTLRELAERAGTSPQVLSEWEIGNVSNPHPRTMLQVATALGLDPREQIFDWQDENQQLLKEDSIEKQLGNFNQGNRTFNENGTDLEPM